MKNFKFSLEKVLSYKEQILTTLRNEMAILNEQIKKIDLDIQALADLYSQTNCNLKEELNSGSCSSNVMSYKIFLNEIDKKARKLQEERKIVYEAIEKKKKEIIAINTEISSLEKLQEKQLEVYNKSVQKANELFIEEFVSNASYST